MSHLLIDSETKRLIKRSDIRKTFRGEEVRIDDWQYKDPPSSGRVYVTFMDNGQQMNYYPSVVGAELIDEREFMASATASLVQSSVAASKEPVENAMMVPITSLDAYMIGKMMQVIECGGAKADFLLEVYGDLYVAKGYPSFEDVHNSWPRIIEVLSNAAIEALGKPDDDRR